MLLSYAMDSKLTITQMQWYYDARAFQCEGAIQRRVGCFIRSCWSSVQSWIIYKKPIRCFVDYYCDLDRLGVPWVKAKDRELTSTSWRISRPYKRQRNYLARKRSPGIYCLWIIVYVALRPIPSPLAGESTYLSKILDWPVRRCFMRGGLLLCLHRECWSLSNKPIIWVTKSLTG
jgi:hypothetical protein